MKRLIEPSAPFGTIKAIASKSAAHRLMICAAFADTETKIRCEETNKDIEATAECLSALGAKIRREAPFYIVSPIKELRRGALLNCNESGSTLRFLIPVAAAIGADADFLMAGRLPERPLSPLREELETHGISFNEAGSNPLSCRGSLSGNFFKIAGNISSQFISGLLFALTLMRRDATLEITGSIESAPYIDMTVDALRIFSAEPQKIGNTYIINGNTPLISPRSIDVEGDWSNAAFPLSLGAIGDGEVSVFGLDPDSHQGDRAIVALLERFGANIEFSNGTYTVSRGELHGIDIDASQIPDLVPILATVASVAKGETKIYGAARLRIKESDRLATTTAMLSSLGANIRELDDGLIINGMPNLSGGVVSSFNDHRIAMSAAVASCVCKSGVTVDGAEATSKSYPAFWEDFQSLKIKSRII